MNSNAETPGQSIYPVTYERYGDKHWHVHPTLNFAKSHTTAPLVIVEVFKAAISFPIGFTRESGSRMPHALLGFEQENNLYVSQSGSWMGRYLPAFFRGYPFCVLPDQNGQDVLCFDESSNVINKENNGWAFFEDEETPSERIQQTINFFDELSGAHKQTKELCKEIEDLDLFEPWTISILDRDGNEAKFDVLDKIDEDKLRSLTSDQIAKLHTSDALAIVYSHLLSLQNLQLLERLIEAQNSTSESDIGFSLTEEAGRELNFDF